MKIMARITYLFLLVSHALCLSAYSSLLIKIPTRGHPETFFKTLDAYYKHLDDLSSCSFLITCDIDDQTMNNPEVVEKLKCYPNLSFSFIPGPSPTEAYNYGVYRDLCFDMVLVSSDTIAPSKNGYDTFIQTIMHTSFEHNDGIVNFYLRNDGDHSIPVISVIGKKFFDIFGFIYHPSYTAFFYDYELACTARILKREHRCYESLFQRMAPNHEITVKQALHTNDEQLFKQRRERLFDIPQTVIDAMTPKLWSILICTLENRAPQFNYIYDKLAQQIQDLGLQDQIEILYFKDNRQYPLGFKRNALLQASSGKYVCCVDDDDDVHDHYIQMIYDALQKKPDCVSLTGIITTNGCDPRIFIHSLAHDSYYEKDAIYYRPPNHLNPIKRCFAVQNLVKEEKDGDDQWARKIAADQLLKSESVIPIPYYFYKFITHK